MPSHRSHGRAYVEPERHDELSDGVVAPLQAPTGAERRPNGQFELGSKTVQSKGGRARKGTTELAASMGVDELLSLPEFRPYLSKANAFRVAQCAELAQTVGGGECGIMASSMVKSASLALAGSEFWYARAAASGEPKAFELASKLADASRMSLVYARECAAKIAKARTAAADPSDDFYAIAQALEEGKQ